MIHLRSTAYYFCVAAIGALCVCWQVGAVSRAIAQEKPQRPNILFILADDQRHDTIHALGNEEIHTPNLDRLARNGFHFTNAYCMGSMTPAVCLPSRTMLMT